MEDYTTVDKEYLKAFNQGYIIAQETGLKADTLDKMKPEKLQKLNINSTRLNVVKLGMKQYETDKLQEKTKQKDQALEQKRDDRSKDRSR
ncbi:hypothetical protein [uncultured Kordia sp.]|uniref:hypothetical protein n=1 Tax=uncultured Kordia sp. TaxID=507699 RepID=UPI002609DF70|nr:hypothetical protein [uncultured Kordia sp.]